MGIYSRQFLQEPHLQHGNYANSVSPSSVTVASVGGSAADDEVQCGTLGIGSMNQGVGATLPPGEFELVRQFTNQIKTLKKESR